MAARSFIGYLLLCLLLGTGACRVHRRSTPESQSQARLSEKERLDFSYLFYDALKDKMLGNLPQAKSKLIQAIRVDPRNDAAHFEMAQIYLQEGNLDQALSSANLALKFNPQNIWYKRVLVEIYAQRAEWSKQIALLQEIAKQTPGQTDVLYELADACIMVRKYEEALKLYAQIEKLEGYSEDLLIRKKNLYLSLGKPGKAIEEIRKLVEKVPDEYEYRRILAEVYLMNRQPEKALEQYEEILKRDPQNSFVHFSLADYYRKQGNNERSFEELKLAFMNPDADVNLKIQVLASYFEITEAYPELKNQALTLCEKLIEVSPDDSRAHALYGDFLFRDERFKEARTQYEQALEGDKSRYSVWNQLLLCLNELGETQKLNELSSEASDLFPQQAVFFLYKGLSFMQLKQYEQAVEALREGSLIGTDNKALAVQFLASLGDSYHHLARYSESDQAYEEALLSDSNNIYVLNNYAYYLSIRKTRLDRAELLARRCNTLAPGRPSYEDTYAWVLFQAGKKQEALKWIDRAIASGGNTNSTIWEHQGDIRWSLNQKDGAMESWKKALELGADKNRLETKIREGLPEGQ